LDGSGHVRGSEIEGKKDETAGEKEKALFVVLKRTCEKSTPRKYARCDSV
jgi:hypothetical protein